MTTKNSQAIAPVLVSIAKFNERLEISRQRPQLRAHMFNDLQQGIANFLDSKQGLHKFIEVYGQKTADAYIAALQAMSGIEEVLTAEWDAMQAEGKQILQTFVEQYFPAGEPIEVNLAGLGASIEVQRLISLSTPYPWGGGSPTVVYHEDLDQITFNAIFQTVAGDYWSGCIGINGAGIWTCSLQGPIPDDHPAIRLSVYG